MAIIRLPESVTPLEIALPPEVVSMDTVSPERQEWLWDSRIPLGALTLLDGSANVGKSTLMIDLAARLTTGRPMPFSSAEPLEPMNVLFLTAEDSLEKTFSQRLRATECDLSRVKVWVGRYEKDPEGNVALNGYIALDSHYQDLERIIREHKIGLVVIDVLFAYLGDVNPYEDKAARGLLTPLHHIADRNNCAIVAIRHPRKGQSGESALESGGGSLGFTNACRSVLRVDRHPELDGVAVIAPVKINIAKSDGLAHTYQLVECLDPDGYSYAAKVEWLTLTADQLLAGNKARQKATKEEAAGPTKWRSCEDEIEGYFEGVDAATEDGTKYLDAKWIGERLAEKGYAAATITKAKNRLGITSRQVSGAWRWELKSRTLSI